MVNLLAKYATFEFRVILRRLPIRLRYLEDAACCQADVRCAGFHLLPFRNPLNAEWLIYGGISLNMCHAYSAGDLKA